MKNINLLFLIVPFLSFSQVNLTGVVKDDLKPIPFANVILKDSSNQIVSAGITDDKGEFLLTIDKGTYSLIISFLGYDDFNKEVTLKDNLRLNDVTLLEKKSELDEVLIVSKKRLIERKVDRLVFNVENNITASGGDALDALNVAPGILVEDGQIAMIGKSAMRVMVGGRIIPLSGEELINFLKSIPAGDIKKIEIITNPPAKYEAEGNGGLINIIYKKGVRNSWSNSTGITYTQAVFPEYTLRNNFTYQKDKLHLQLSLNGSVGDINSDQDLAIFYSDGPWRIKTDQKAKSENVSGRLLLDYELNEKTTIGFQYLGKIDNPDIVDRATTEIFNNQNSIDSLLISDGISDKSINNHSLNAHFNTKLDTLGRSISADVNYFEYQSEEQRDILTESVLSNGVLQGTNFSAINGSNQNIKNYSGKIDVEHPLKTIDLSYGAKVSVINSNYETNFFNTISGEPVLDLLQSDKFEYNEYIQALYVNTYKEIGKKWKAQLGLRFESSQTEGISIALNQTNTNDYTKLFPTFYLSYDMNEKNSFSFNYGKRINRPSYNQLNPARFYVNSNTFSEGNPFLQPSFTDNLEFSYTYKRKWFTNLFLSIDTDGFGVIPSINEETNDQVFQQQNFYTNYHYGISETYIFNKFSWWTSQNSVYLIGSESVFDTDNINAEVQNGYKFYFATNNTFSLNTAKTIHAQLNYWYVSPARENLFRSEESYKLDLILKFSMLKKNLQLSMGVYDILNSSPRNLEYNINGIRQTYVNRARNQYFRTSLSYNFGNNKIRAKRRNFGNEEEKRRAKN